MNFLLENEPNIVKDYLLKICEQTYWNMVEMTNVKKLAKDHIGGMLKLQYLYKNTPFNYYTRLDNKTKIEEIKRLLPDYFNSDNILNNILQLPDDEILKQLDLLDNYKVKILLMQDGDTLFIPTEFKKDKEGFEEIVFLELPMKELVTIKNNIFFKELKPVNMFDFNTLVYFKKISCSNRFCYWVDISLGLLIRLAIKYKQKNKLIGDRNLILDIYNVDIIKIETNDDGVVDFLNSVNNKNVKYYMLDIKYNEYVSLLPFNKLPELIIKPFHSVKYSYTKRFLKYVKRSFNNKTFINILNKDIFNYVNRKWDNISYTKLLEELPVLRLVKEDKKDLDIILILTNDPYNYVKELENKETDKMFNKCLVKLLKKKIAYISE